MKRSKIISDLIQDNITVERAILVLKVLLNENDNTEIKNWINNEINGYEINDTIPKYRHIPTNVIGTVHNPAKIVKNMSLPIANIKKNYRDVIEGFDERGGIQEIAQKARAENETASHHLSRALPLEFMNAIGIPVHGQIIEARQEFSIYAYNDILSKIKIKVLDILLELEKNFGNLDDLYIDFSSASEVHNVENKIIAIIYDNSIHIGNNNKIKETNIGESNEN